METVILRELFCIVRCAFWVPGGGVRRIKYSWPRPKSGLLEAALPGLGPAPDRAPPGRPEEEGARGHAREGQGQLRPADAGDDLVLEEVAGDVAQGEHGRADAGVVLDGDAQVGVLVHVGEEVRVPAPLDQPALALEAPLDGLVARVQGRPRVQGRDDGHGRGADEDHGRHALPQHLGRAPRTRGYI